MPPYPKPERARKGKTRFQGKNDTLSKAKKLKGRAHAIRKSPYLHPAWIKLRDAVRKRAKGRCEGPHCRGASNGAHCHHLRYGPGSGWRRLIVPMSQILLLCEDCHSAEHPLNARGNMLKIKFKDGWDD